MPGSLRSSGTSATPDHLAHVGGCERVAVETQLPGGRTKAEQRLQQLGASGADQAAEADDLAGPYRERQGRCGTLDQEVVDLQHDRGGWRGRAASGKQLGQLAAHHAGDDLGLGDACRRDMAHQPAVAHDGDGIGDLLDLLHAVAGVEDAYAACPQRADDPEQLLGFPAAQRRRRLIHQHDPGVARGRLEDLHHLRGRGAERLHRRIGIEVELDAAQHRCRLVSHGAAPLDAERTADLPADQQVLPQPHVRQRRQFLRNDRDAQRPGVARIETVNHMTLQREGAGIGVQLPGNQLEQRRLPGTVLAGKDIDRARVEIDGDVAQNRHAAEGLCQAEAGHARHQGRRRCLVDHDRHGRCRAGPAFRCGAVHLPRYIRPPLIDFLEPIYRSYQKCCKPARSDVVAILHRKN